MIPFMKKRFGSPMSFPEGSVLSKLMTRYIISLDDTTTSYSHVSCTERAYKISEAKHKGQLDIDDYAGTPHPSELGKFVPIVLPSYVIQRTDTGLKMSMPATPYLVLSVVGAQKIREVIRKIFWTDLTQYCNTYADGDLRRDESSTHKNHIIAFLRRHNIPEDFLETVNRTDTRLQVERK